MMVTRELGDPLRRDALFEPIRWLEKNERCAWPEQPAGAFPEARERRSARGRELLQRQHADRGHHAFVLVLEDVAVEDELADLVVAAERDDDVDAAGDVARRPVAAAGRTPTEMVGGGTIHRDLLVVPAGTEAGVAALAAAGNQDGVVLDCLRAVGRLANTILSRIVCLSSSSGAIRERGSTRNLL